MSLSIFFFFSSRRRHTRWTGDWSSDVCSSDLLALHAQTVAPQTPPEAQSQTHSAAQSPTAEQTQSPPGTSGANITIEIGRASCRERVEISEVAESLKKKNENEKRDKDKQYMNT